LEIDSEQGKVWVYPTDFPEREYQFQLARRALEENTLVCLPTGLGKTFVAAVVMFNFRRWFPGGIVVFVAPSRPLVHQQMRACRSMMGVEEEEICELTGKVKPTVRKSLWEVKPMVFLTPQVMDNDLTNRICPVKRLVCIVLDEAHRATKNHSYAQLTSTIAHEGNQACRIVGLSATPGSNVEAIQEVIINLRSSSLLYYDESDPEVQPYVFDRKVETITIPQDESIRMVMEQAATMLQPLLESLTRSGVLQSRNPGSVSTIYLMSARDAWRKGAASLASHEKWNVESTFAMAMSWCHGLAVLQSHGLVSFHKYLQGIQREASEKRAMAKMQFTSKPSFQSLCSRVQSIVSAGGCHPKVNKCLEVLRTHFDSMSDERKVIIFVEYREAVFELERQIEKLKPTVRCCSFVGQSAGKGGPLERDALKGLNQSKQQQVLADFRGSRYNVMISTSIGEEGLDIGEVDLLILYDALRSPVRMVQRMGRTGRKRNGKIVVLLTVGVEERKFAEMNRASDSLKRKLRDPTAFHFSQPETGKLQLDYMRCVRQRLYRAPTSTDQGTTSKRSEPPRVTNLRHQWPITRQGTRPLREKILDIVILSESDLASPLSTFRVGTTNKSRTLAEMSRVILRLSDWPSEGIHKSTRTGGQASGNRLRKLIDDEAECDSTQRQDDTDETQGSLAEFLVSAEREPSENYVDMVSVYRRSLLHLHDNDVNEIRR